MVYKLIRRPNKKNALLDHAAGIVSAQGFEALTIDALAKAAGVTKGGVQYHFSSKDELIIQLLEYLLQGFDALLEERPKQHTWLEAYVSALLEPEMEGDRAVSSILSALPPHDPRTAPFDAYLNKWRKRAEESGIDPLLSQIIRLAADGLWLERSHHQTSQRDIRPLVERLMQLIKGNKK